MGKPQRPAWWYHERHEFGQVNGTTWSGQAVRFIEIELLVPPPGTPDKFPPFVGVGVNFGGKTEDVFFSNRESLKELADLLMKAYHELPDVLTAIQYKQAVQSQTNP